jgi:hypothetical protein
MLTNDRADVQPSEVEVPRRRRNSGGLGGFSVRNPNCSGPVAVEIASLVKTGRDSFGKGQNEVALACFRQAIQLDPSHVDAQQMVSRIEATRL